MLEFQLCDVIAVQYQRSEVGHKQYWNIAHQLVVGEVDCLD
jgi:hypothetical protein